MTWMNGLKRVKKDSLINRRVPMKIEFEQEDIEAIAHSIVERLKPLFLAKKEKVDDIIFDVKGLAAYLKVSTKWIYERTHLKEIPHIKVGGFLRFNKKDINKWIDSYAVKAF